MKRSKKLNFYHVTINGVAAAGAEYWREAMGYYEFARHQRKPGMVIAIVDSKSGRAILSCRGRECG